MCRAWGEAVRDGPRVKICGLTRNEDAREAEALGADLLGFVLTAGFGRSVDPANAPAVVHGTTLPRVAVLVDEPPSRAAELANGIDAGVIQLQGSESREMVRAVRELGSWTLWKAVRARDASDVVRVVDTFGDLVDGFLVEGWREGVVGGGGVTVEVGADEVRSAVPDAFDFVLAGGLAPGSLAEAVARFRPDVVDVSSGVERAPGVKSPALVAAFIRAARPGER